MKELKSTVKRTGLLASSLLCSALLMAVPFRKELNEGWKFKQARLTNWYPATVPGVIHTDLPGEKKWFHRSSLLCRSIAALFR